jgi:hypothetical protein
MIVCLATQVWEWIGKRKKTESISSVHGKKDDARDGEHRRGHDCGRVLGVAYTSPEARHWCRQAIVGSSAHPGYVPLPISGFHRSSIVELSLV